LNFGSWLGAVNFCEIFAIFAVAFKEN